ncbi:MAG: GNAT family N-acetyltransferase [Alphaproteobacteria bacterium]|nr:GNAT family N-acetyltransferase [Alphaproteobacteria bacterium]
MSLQIRRIRPDEGLQLRALRLKALANAPTAFGSTLAQEEAFAEDVWHARAVSGAAGTDLVTFIAELDGRWVGLATGLALGSDRSEPELVGMFVDGEARRLGVGGALVESVVGWARARGALRLTLSVTATNQAAIALYRRCGFQPTGAAKSLAHDPTLVAIEMACGMA